MSWYEWYELVWMKNGKLRQIKYELAWMKIVEKNYFICGLDYILLILREKKITSRLNWILEANGEDSQNIPREYDLTCVSMRENYMSKPRQFRNMPKPSQARNLLVCVGMSQNHITCQSQVETWKVGMRWYECKSEIRQSQDKSEMFWYASVWVKIYKSRQIKQGNFGCPYSIVIPKIWSSIHYGFLYREKMQLI